MAISCDPAELAAAAKCYCLDPVTREKAKVYLLAVIAGKDNLTPSQLAEAAKCYCFDHATMNKVLAYLACEGANSGGGDGDACVQVISEDPVGSPSGNILISINSTNNNTWYWDGAAWVLLIGP